LLGIHWSLALAAVVLFISISALLLRTSAVAPAEQEPW